MVRALIAACGPRRRPRRTGMFGNGTNRSPADPDRYFTLARADIVVHRMEGASGPWPLLLSQMQPRTGWHLMWDFHCLRDVRTPSAAV
jgi:hypothetical protein